MPEVFPSLQLGLLILYCLCLQVPLQNDLVEPLITENGFWQCSQTFLSFAPCSGGFQSILHLPPVT